MATRNLADVGLNLQKIVNRLQSNQQLLKLLYYTGKDPYSEADLTTSQIKNEVFVPLTQWIIKDSNLRPFAIMGEIHKSLNGKTIDGLGKMTGGDFKINFLTDEIGCYEMVYSITSYD